MNGPKTEREREPKVESFYRGIWRVKVSEAERRVHDRDGHSRRDMKGQTCGYTSSLVCLSCIAFFVRRGASEESKEEELCDQSFSS